MPQSFTLPLQDDIDGATELEESGRRFIEEDHYAIDCIRPKCIELLQMVQQYREVNQARLATLERSRDLHERIDKVLALGHKAVLYV